MKKNQQNTISVNLIDGPINAILLIRDMVVKSWNRRFGSETVGPIQKFTSMKLLQMPCVVT